MSSLSRRPGCSALIIIAALGTWPGTVSAKGFKTIATFAAGQGSGSNSGLIEVGDDFYGVRYGGGSGLCGVVYKLSAGVISVVYNFTGTGDGCNPSSTLVADSDGNLYGTTAYTTGNQGTLGDGTIFKIGADGTFASLHQFNGTDGEFPQGAMILDRKGNLYGTTQDGGASGAGSVFELKTNGTLVTLYSFHGADGGQPTGPLLDVKGTLYGTTYGGGSSGKGTVFALAPDGTLTTVYDFTSATKYAIGPESGLIMDKSGFFYGTTYYGGDSSDGTVFKVALDGTFATLVSFNFTDGANPVSAPSMDKAGNLNGITYSGGTSGYGTVYSLAPNGTLTILHNFTDKDDGGYPYPSGLLAKGGHSYYGTTSRGGIGAGTIFEVTP